MAALFVVGLLASTTAYAEPINTGVTATGEWGTWLMMGYDPATEKQIPAMSGFGTLGDCVENITEGKKGYVTPMPAQETWPKLVLYCVPADVVPADGVGILPKRGR